MEESKSFWQIIKGTLLSTADKEGSAKRATSLYFVVILLTTLTFVYEYCFYIAATSPNPTIVQVSIVNMYQSIHWSLQVSTWMFLGLATLETLTNFWKAIKGDKTSTTEEKK